MSRTPWQPSGAAAQPFRWSTLQHDLPEHRLRSPALTHLGRDRYVPTARADDPLALAQAVALALPPGAALSHLTAAALGRAPLPVGADPWRPLHVSVPTDWQAPRRRLVAGHRMDLPAEHVTTAFGLPVTTPVRMFLDLGAVLDVPALVAIGDFSLRAGLVDPPALRHALANAGGRRGVRRARAALDLLDPGAESAQESVLRVHLVGPGCPVRRSTAGSATPRGGRAIAATSSTGRTG